MTLVAFLSQLRRLDVEVWVENERLRYSAPPGVVTAELRATIVERKAELIAFLKNTSATAEQLSAPIAPIARDGELPLSIAQAWIWRGQQAQPGNSAFHLVQTVQLSGPLDRTLLERSIDEIARRHETLRSTFPAAHGRPRLLIAPHKAGALPIQHVQAAAASAPESELQRLIAAAIGQPFDLACGPLIRLTLLQFTETEHVLIFALHLIIADTFSISLFIREFAALYAAFAAGQPSPLPELALQYVDIVAWQHHQESLAADHVAYWKRQLADAPRQIALSTARRRPPSQTPRRARQELLIPKDVLTAIEALSYREGATVAMTLLAALHMLLHRTTGQPTQLIGLPTPGRPRKEADGLIGHFANLVAIRADLGQEQRFLALLKQVSATCLDAYPHQDLPFEQLVAELAPEQAEGGHPLFQVFFSLRESFGPLSAADLRLHQREIYNEAAPFDLALLLQTHQAGLYGCFDYDADLFDATTIARMSEHFQTLLQRISSPPE
jgi:hypothetical protein